MGKRSVLIVDDEEGIRNMLAIALDAAGFHVETATDGADASTVLERSRFDVIVADMLMPERDGLELLAEVKKKHKGTAFVAISGGGQVAGKFYLEMAKRLGASEILAKPFNHIELLRVIDDAMGHPVGATES